MALLVASLSYGTTPESSLQFSNTLFYMIENMFFVTMTAFGALMNSSTHGLLQTDLALDLQVSCDHIVNEPKHFPDPSTETSIPNRADTCIAKRERKKKKMVDVLFSYYSLQCYCMFCTGHVPMNVLRFCLH